MCHRMYFLDLQQLDRWLNGWIQNQILISQRDKSDDQMYICTIHNPMRAQKLLSKLSEITIELYFYSIYYVLLRKINHPLFNMGFHRLG